MSINSVAAKIWNEIAEQANLKTSWAKKAFRMNEDELIELEDKEYEALENRDVEPEVIRAFLDVRHLLTERVAIAAYVKKHPELRGALPEVNSVNEAILLVTGDWPLSPSETSQLKELLNEALNES
jgi:hypothetical protein